ncbi:hypothetical protein BCR34DRAFT_670914 [Clohesyomyces aquaticus]|uniref:Uncharacterized protein n=1 Tax=Clohesyomyces aquaticus TaxID=1231657 RepID=A0A1Y2A6L9_9PLEO|nr:hypothetical protein BCR34DRAFT_670914 [Clohesyomyces aquaticus]
MYTITILSTLVLLVQISTASVIPRADSLFGTCSDPTIIIVQNEDGMVGPGFKAHNTNDFPHGPSDTITAITDIICSRLQNFCHAPANTITTCTNAATAVKGKTGQEAADAFNNAITATTPTATSSAKPSPATPTALVTPKINVVLSSSTVDFEDEHEYMDPRWWFDNKIVATGDPAICNEGPVRMPHGYYITFTCAGADSRMLPLMRAQLNAMVEATIDNSTAKDEERIFKHWVHEKWGPDYTTEYWKTTTWPASAHIEAALDIPGVGGALSGNIRYTITKGNPGSCKICSFLSTSGTTSAAGTKMAEVALEWGTNLNFPKTVQ